jgi:hypothetical protein
MVTARVVVIRRIVSGTFPLPLLCVLCPQGQAPALFVAEAEPFGGDGFGGALVGGFHGA